MPFSSFEQCAWTLINDLETTFPIAKKQLARARQAAAFVRIRIPGLLEFRFARDNDLPRLANHEDSAIESFQTYGAFDARKLWSYANAATKRRIWGHIDALLRELPDPVPNPTFALVAAIERASNGTTALQSTIALVRALGSETYDPESLHAWRFMEEDAIASDISTRASMISRMFATSGR